ncbi:MAG: UDP-N-acetylmuramoyl-L-alanyl-D-glutamate--2,6-diaminopimelate ligase [Polyangiales bacterium]|nr:UDP-N-acetylmuramoyl-L-alanyl-D-glutamate--2,6-diaminopimelate ligase [Myxococcales bacterium]MCB9657014.1 UDP-N-acetylmuramoyl-L-alanyl-D-glutamate--2,6-diaminopimelate ligase [Sandaracinaceae bacterium]
MSAPRVAQAARTLADLVRLGVAETVLGDGDAVVTGVQRDSRRVAVGDLFVALPGEHVDGRAFVDAAVAAGATAVLTGAEVPELAVPQLISADVRSGLARAAHAVYGDPSRALTVVGLTGTNGKTTTSYLLEGILAATGRPVALIGTVAVRGPGYVTSSGYTTPEADDLVRYLAQAVTAGATHLVMEVSSHGLELERVAGVRFDVCGFTNLTQDHLDFHPSMEAYGEAKARLFTEYAPRVSVICVDAPFGAQLAERAVGEVLRCSVRADSDAPLRAVSWTMSRAGIEASLETPAGELRLMSPMVGAHNLENLLVAVGCAASLGVPWDVAVAACAHLPGAPGRLERVPCDEDVAVFVDYAHTPDALERTVRALRALTPGRLITVFGCGGDRDKGKRPLMARAACGASDLVVITSDNPRTEAPESILDDVEQGCVDIARVSPEQLSAAARGYTRVSDRRAAIALAVSSARPGDSVLIAGKGHEDYQILGTTKHPFDDRVEAREALAARAQEVR